MKDEASGVPSWDILRPELAAGVSVDAPLADGGPWVIAVERIPRARVGEDFARIAELFDGRRSLREAVVASGVVAEPAQVIGVVHALAGAGLLRPGSVEGVGDTPSGERATRAIGSRLRFRAPLTVQWEVFDPSALAAALARSVRRRGVAAVLCVMSLGTSALAVAAIAICFDEIAGTLMAPVRIELLLPLILAVIGTGCLHELSHAVTLAAMGGRPTRMGIMLLLGMPAFFCDVTDGWRIGERWRRAAVALAGPALHLLLAAASFALLLAVEAPPSRSFLILYGCACGAAVVANLIPLLKLDGYLALVAITDTPHLRANAIEAMRRAIARIFFQVDPRPGTPRDSPWFVAFGLLCAGFPLLLFVWAAVRLQPMFLGLGPWMAVVYLVLVLTFVIVTAWRVARFIAGCLRDRPRIPRAIVAPAVLSAAVLLALLIPTPTTARAGFVVRDDHPLLIVTSSAMLESVMDGARVRLLSNGIVLRPEVGTAVVDGDQFSAVPIDAPLEAVGPITDPGVTVPALALHLTDVVSSDRLPGAGAASIDQHSRPAGAVLLSVLVVEPLQTIFAWARS